MVGRNLHTEAEGLSSESREARESVERSGPGDPGVANEGGSELWFGGRVAFSELPFQQV